MSVETAKKQTSETEKEGRIKILIHKTEGDAGSTHVPVSLNGNTFLIKRGETVAVPPGYVEVLKNAIKLVYQQNDKLEMEVKEVEAYPFSIVG